MQSYAIRYAIGVHTMFHNRVKGPSTQFQTVRLLPAKHNPPSITCKILYVKLLIALSLKNSRFNHAMDHNVS